MEEQNEHDKLRAKSDGFRRWLEQSRQHLMREDPKYGLDCYREFVSGRKRHAYGTEDYTTAVIPRHQLLGLVEAGSYIRDNRPLPHRHRWESFRDRARRLAKNAARIPTNRYWARDVWPVRVETVATIKELVARGGTGFNYAGYVVVPINYHVQVERMPFAPFFKYASKKWIAVNWERVDTQHLRDKGIIAGNIIAFNSSAEGTYEELCVAVHEGTDVMGVGPTMRAALSQADSKAVKEMKIDLS